MTENKPGTDPESVPALESMLDKPLEEPPVLRTRTAKLLYESIRQLAVARHIPKMGSKGSTYKTAKEVMQATDEKAPGMQRMHSTKKSKIAKDIIMSAAEQGYSVKEALMVYDAFCARNSLDDYLTNNGEAPR
jgi:hypothetical protein